MEKTIYSPIVSVVKFATVLGLLSLIPLTSLAVGIEPDTAFPIASIGVGNGNSPVNTGPNHNTTYSGIVPVYATFTDEHPDNYHFRVIAEESAEGHTCGNLFALENQDYNKCGFAYNQSMYVGAGFTNAQIASIDTTKLGTDGLYWFVLGVVDTSGNRTNPNYLEDPRVRVIVDNTKPATASSTPESNNGNGGSSDGSSSNGGGGGGIPANGSPFPITFAHTSPQSGAGNSSLPSTPTQNQSQTSGGGGGSSDSSPEDLPTTPTYTDTQDTHTPQDGAAHTTPTDDDQSSHDVATTAGTAAGLFGFSGKAYIPLIIIALIALLLWYFFGKKKDKK